MGCCHHLKKKLVEGGRDSECWGEWKEGDNEALSTSHIHTLTPLSSYPLLSFSLSTHNHYLFCPTSPFHSPFHPILPSYSLSPISHWSERVSERG